MELADRLRAMTNNVETYKANGETDEQILATAAEIDSNMAYLGMDDAIIEIAAEVEKIAQEGEYHEYEIRVDVTGFDPSPDSIILARLPKAASHEIFEKVTHYLKFKFPDHGVIVMHEDADIDVLPDPAERILNYLASLHQQAKMALPMLGSHSQAEKLEAALKLPPDIEAAIEART